MPSTISELFDVASLKLIDMVPWGRPIDSKGHGIYIVSLSDDPDSNSRFEETAPIDYAALREWLRRVPGMELGAQVNPSPDALANRLAEFWLPDESILYIGQTMHLQKRVNAYYRTQLRRSKPHRGGHWIKTLSVLNKTFIHFAEASYPKEDETLLLHAFADRVSSATKSRLGDPECPLPYANLELPGRRKRRKRHGLKKTTRG